MRNQNDAYAMGATRVAVGLSQVIRIIPGEFDYWTSLKITAAGGTLEIVKPQLSGSSTAAGGAWGTGYMLGATEVLPIYGAAAIYLAATGATMVASLALGKTSGATLL